MRDYLNRLRQQFQRFMIGRYGMDQFGRFLSGVLLALIIFNLLILSWRTSYWRYWS